MFYFIMYFTFKYYAKHLAILRTNCQRFTDESSMQCNPSPRWREKPLYTIPEFHRAVQSDSWMLVECFIYFVIFSIWMYSIWQFIRYTILIFFILFVHFLFFSLKFLVKSIILLFTFTVAFLNGWSQHQGNHTFLPQSSILLEVSRIQR